MGNPFGEVFNQGDNSSIDSGQAGVQNDGQAQGTGYNPNFQPLLNDLPQDLHPKVLPHLQGWDQQVNSRFEKLQSDLAPFRSVLNQPGVTPEMLSNGLAMLNLLESNPRSLYDTLGSSFNFTVDSQQGSGQGQSLPGQDGQQSAEDPYAAKFAQMEQNMMKLGEHVLNGERAKQAAAEDAALAKEFADAHDKLGKFDETWVQARLVMNPDLSVVDAAKQYQTWFNQQLAAHGARPIIAGNSGGSGGVPGQTTTDVTKLSGKETRNLVADMIIAAKRQAQ